mgnify:CR=1 FL=1
MFFLKYIACKDTLIFRIDNQLFVFSLIYFVLLRFNNDKKQICCGCMAQEESVVEDIKTKYKWVDIVFGTHNIHKLPEILEESIFDKKQAKVVLLEENGESVGFALYFFNFSTWRGKAGLYLEDLFVRPQYRGKGYGKMLLSYLANQAVEQDCPRFEWIVLDWNQPSIDFYKAMGAKPLDEWTVFRLENEKLNSLAKSYRTSCGLED